MNVIYFRVEINSGDAKLKTKARWMPGRAMVTGDRRLARLKTNNGGKFLVLFNWQGECEDSETIQSTYVTSCSQNVFP